MSVNLCDDCIYEHKIEVFEERSITNTIHTDIYCKVVSAQIYGQVQKCSTYLRKINFVRKEDL